MLFGATVLLLTVVVKGPALHAHVDARVRTRAAGGCARR
jgi:hypothetical protein